jgi:putative ABC transport system permease protein
MTPLVRRVIWWLRRRRLEEEIRQELEFHLEEEAEERRATGLSDDQARRAARRDLGNATVLREDIRTLWNWMFLEQLAQDIRYASRALQRSPGFTAVAVLTLALGIGMNTAIFSVINALMLRPLPYPDPGALVLIETSPLTQASRPLMAAWRDGSPSLRDLAGSNGPRAATLVYQGESRQVQIAGVTWNFLSFLGARASLGRDFMATDEDRGAPVVAILSDEFWGRAFGRDPAIVGKSVTLTTNPVTIVGVAPAGFRFPTVGAASAPGMAPDTQPDVFRVGTADASFNVIGRLAPRVTPASAAAELLSIFKHESSTILRPTAVAKLELRATPLQDRLIGDVRKRLWLVAGAVGLVLLVGCANVANLLLARASTRQRELALRRALGAPAGRIARLVLTESLLLSLLGSVVGLGFAYLSSGAARMLLANRIPHVETITIDGVVLVFNIVVALATGLVCGVVSLPGFRRISLTAIFDGGARQVTARSGIRHVLLSAETAITFVLVVAAALLAQTLWNLQVQDKGFDAHELLTVRVTAILPDGINQRDRLARSSFLAAFFNDLRDRLERIPGVASAAAVSLGPLDGISAGFVDIKVDGQKVSSEEILTPIAFVTPHYFPTLRIPIIAGRDFRDSDRLGTDLVVIVNEAFQRRFVPHGDILGARVSSGSGPEGFTIIGVTRDVPDRSLRQSPEPLLIAPIAQMPDVHISWGSLTFVLRTTEPGPLRLAPEVRRTVWAVNPNIVINEFVTMNARVAGAMQPERDSAIVFGLFAVTALIMAAIGVYGIAAYTIAQRTKEIGIRVALGAARRDVTRLVLSHTFWPTVIGIFVGVGAATWLTRLMVSMVYGVTPLDPVAFVGGVLVLLSVALAGTWIPTRRAIRIDPLVALRHD